VSGGRREEQLTSGPGDKIVPSWSRDGRYVLFIYIGSTTAEDIWALPLEGDRKPFPVLQGIAVETNPDLSPDGRWLARAAVPGAWRATARTWNATRT
jgi:Tol biopolymer transport system component